MKRPIKLIYLLLAVNVTTIGCTDTTGPFPMGINDGEFVAIIDGTSDFRGDAGYEIIVPTSEWTPDVYSDSVLFLTLKTGEINSNRGTSVTIGLMLNTLWDNNSEKLDIGSTTIINSFVDPNTLEYYVVRSGFISIRERSNDLLVGEFNLRAAVDSSDSDSLKITGEFRAKPKQ
ncbi:MAG: hypothetical protein U5K71_02400 [Gracilimonas sp.]|nr:hypothetical protein [Gracilimonas sp.]